MGALSQAVPPVTEHNPALGQSDADAVLERLASGGEVDPALLERVRASAALITAEIQRKHGLVDDGTFQSLLDDEA